MKTENPPIELPQNVQRHSFFARTSGYLALILIGVNIWYFCCDDSNSPSALSRSFWYADFRFWPAWVTSCCWIAVVWACSSVLISLFIPKNKDQPFLLQRSFSKKVVSSFFLFWIWSVWYKNATLSLGTLFAPLLSPVTDYLNCHYSIPLANYQTSGEGSNPLFWPIVATIVFAVLFVTWRVWFHVKHWKKSKNIAAALLLCCFSNFALGADSTFSSIPPKVETSVGIYDVQSKDDIHQLTAEEVRELVRMENERVGDSAKPPHPILVHCFEELSFQYTGGKYDKAEIKFRLHVPKNIKPGKKYPLVIHLHGAGESGNDNMRSLAHLHSILPILLGPEQLDFFMLVTQCPQDNQSWSFRAEKDGNLDIAVAATDHIVQNYPIDTNRVSVFGLSSGGYGIWQWLAKEPNRFAAAVPTACSFSGNYSAINHLQQTSVWTFINKGDGGIAVPPIYNAVRIFEQVGGQMKLTRFDQGGHAAWRPAMGEYNCFSWMIAQKRGGWFNPPPERNEYQGRSFSNSVFAFFLPLVLAGGLFLFQRTSFCENLHKKIADHLYHREDDDEYDDNEEEPEDDESVDEIVADGFQILTDMTGTKKIQAKVLGFEGDFVMIQSPHGKKAKAAIKQFSMDDQIMLQKMRDAT